MARHPIHIVCGSAGSGKSTYAAGLASELGAAVLDSDDVSERLAKLVLATRGMDPDDRDSPEYKQLLREPIYETLYDLAGQNCEFVPCVVVGPFTRECQDAGWPGALRATLKTTVHIHYVYCDPEERRRRIQQRDNPRDRLKLEDWQGYLAMSSDAPPSFEHRFIDTSPQI